MSREKRLKRYLATAAVVAAASALIATPAMAVAGRGGGASPPARLGTHGWSGYSWYTRSWQVTASMRLPYVYPARNAGVAFWAGFGNGPGIEQTGFTANMVDGHLQWTEWYELYPAPPVRFGWRANSGDEVSMTVSYQGGGWFKLTIHDLTRRWWSSVWRHTSTPSMGIAEAIVEAYGPPLARFTPARFYNISAIYPRQYRMPGTDLSSFWQGSFTVHD